MTGYATMAELFEAEANGFGVVIVMRKRTAAGTDNTFVRLVGPFADRSKARPMVIKMTSDWWVQNAATINSWVALTGTKGPNGQPLMSADEFFDNLRRNLLDYEVAHNAIRQALLNRIASAIAMAEEVSR